MWFSPIEDQGNIGLCTANAAVGVVEYYERSKLISKIKAYLASGLPSMFGFTVYDSIRQASRDGEIPFPCPGKELVAVMPLLQSGMMTKRKSRMLIAEQRLRMHYVSKIHGAKDEETEDTVGYHTSMCSKHRQGISGCFSVSNGLIQGNLGDSTQVQVRGDIRNPSFFKLSECLYIISIYKIRRHIQDR